MSHVREKLPPVRPKGAPPVKNNNCVHTAPGGVLEFTLGSSDAVLGKVEIDSHGIIGEVDAPAGQGEKLIVAGVEAAGDARVRALAERLKCIRRQAPVLHRPRWSLYVHSTSPGWSRSVCLRGIRAIFALWRFGRPDNPEDGLPLGVKEGSPPAFRPSITRSQNRAHF